MKKKLLVLLSSIMLVGCGRDISTTPIEQVHTECIEALDKYKYFNILYDTSVEDVDYEFSKQYWITLNKDDETYNYCYRDSDNNDLYQYWEKVETEDVDTNYLSYTSVDDVWVEQYTPNLFVHLEPYDIAEMLKESAYVEDGEWFGDDGKVHDCYIFGSQYSMEGYTSIFRYIFVRKKDMLIMGSHTMGYNNTIVIGQEEEKDKVIVDGKEVEVTSTGDKYKTFVGRYSISCSNDESYHFIDKPEESIPAQDYIKGE